MKLFLNMEMCLREKTSLQRGMNYQLCGNHSVILMSTRKNAPYKDKIIEDGTVLIYEGHNVTKNSQTVNPKDFDQPEISFTGKPTQNGKFHKAAQASKMVCVKQILLRFMKKFAMEFGHTMEFLS